MTLEEGREIGIKGLGKNRTWTQEQFERWIELRIGFDGHPVYWYATGDVFMIPGGERVLRIEGLDVARSTKISDSQYRSVQRKIFVFRDVETNEVVTEYKGMKLKTLAYSYQSMLYSLEDGALVARTTMGSGDQIVTLVGDRFYWRELGDTFVITSPLFTERGWCENYDFFCHPASAGLKLPYQVSWVGWGPMDYLPSKQGAIETAGARFDAFEDVPETMRTFIETSAPLWRNPPEDVDEIQALQQPK